METLSENLKNKYRELMNWNFNDNKDSGKIHTFEYKLMR